MIFIYKEAALCKCLIRKREREQLTGTNLFERSSSILRQRKRTCMNNQPHYFIINNPYKTTCNCNVFKHWPTMNLIKQILTDAKKQKAIVVGAQSKHQKANTMVNIPTIEVDEVQTLFIDDKIFEYELIQRAREAEIILSEILTTCEYCFIEFIIEAYKESRCPNMLIRIGILKTHCFQVYLKQWTWLSISLFFSVPRKEFKTVRNSRSFVDQIEDQTSP